MLWDAEVHRPMLPLEALLNRGWDKEVLDEAQIHPVGAFYDSMDAGPSIACLISVLLHCPTESSIKFSMSMPEDWDEDGDEDILGMIAGPASAAPMKRRRLSGKQHGVQ